MPTTSYTISTAFPTARVAGGKLRQEIAADATVGALLLGVTAFRSLDRCDVETTTTLTAPQKAALDTIVSTHLGTEDVALRLVAPVRIIEDTPLVLVSGSWQDIGAQPSKLDALMGDLTRAFGAITLEARTGGSGALLRLVERDANGQNEVNLTAGGSVSVPDTGAAFKALALSIPQAVAPRQGVNIYVVQGDRGGAVLFELRRTVLSLFEIIVLS